jgi:DNA-binding beta-propeller fold protein YncE
MPRLGAALLLAVPLFFLLAAPADAQQATKVAITATEVAFDPVGGKLYASVPGNAATYANNVVEVDPATGVVTRAVYVGSSPRRMAISDDGRYLYVGIDGAYAVRRVDLTTMTAGLQFGLGAHSWSGPNMAYDIAVVPGDAASVAVVRAPSSSSTSDDGVAVYTDGVLRQTAAIEPIWYGAKTIAFGSATRLYGYDNKTTARDFFRFNVDAGGVSLLDSVGDLIGSNTDIVYSGGLLFSGQGAILDPESRTTVGTLPSFGSYARKVVVDASAARIYAMSASSPLSVWAFDSSTLQNLWAASVPGSSNVVSFVGVGAGTFAYTTSGGDLYLVGTGGSSVLSVRKAGTGNGKVTSSPAAVQCGERCDVLLPTGSAVTLTVSAEAGSRFVGWEGQADCADGSVTVSASLACRAIFEQTKVSVDVQLPLLANDLLYAGGTLYASIPGKQSLYGNGIAAIDPKTGAVTDWFFVGSEPNKLALADDGKTLYVGLDGASAVRRVDLATMTAGLQFPLQRPGASPEPLMPGELAIVPGEPDSLAVFRPHLYDSGDDGVAIYTHGVPRPTTVPGPYRSRLIAFSATSNRLYGFDGYDFVRMRVDATGVSVQDTTGGLLSRGDNLVFADGTLYCGGRVLSPESLTPAGALPQVGYGFTRVAVDVSGRRLYAASSYPHNVKAFDLASLRQLWSVTIADQPGSLVQTGVHGLAYVTGYDRRLHLLKATGAHALIVSKSGTGGGTITNAESGVDCGEQCTALLPDGASVALKATPANGSRFVGWQGDGDCSDGSVTMTAARNCIAVFAQLTTGLGLVVPLTAKDLAYSPLTGRLYATVPGSHPTLGNTLTVIDPDTGALGPSVYLGSEPRNLAVSSDGGTLYVGLDGTATVARVDAVTLGVVSRVALGADSSRRPLYAGAFAPMPGVPGSIAVVRRNLDYTGDEDVALIADGALRPNVLALSYARPTFGGSRARLYVNASGLLRVDVGGDGLTRVDETPTLSVSGRMTWAGGRLYEDGPRVIDPEARTVVGTLPFVNDYSRSVAPDISRGVVYALVGSTSTPALERYDPARFSLVDSVSLAPMSGTPTSLITAGAARLAFRTDTSVGIFKYGQTVTDLVSIQSSSPASGVAISASISDVDGQASGQTPMLRTYARGTVVTLSAPATVGARIFYSWSSGFTTLSTSRTYSTTINGSVTLTATYRYPAPTVASISPDSGRTTGGTPITITGTGFQAGATVTLGAAATDVVVLSDTTITAKTAAYSAGPVSLSVQNTDGQSGFRLAIFTYLSTPTVVGVAPGVGPISGGTTITLTGTSFVQGSTLVSIGGSPATDVTVVNSTTLTAVTPASIKGPAVVVVSTDCGAAMASAPFNYLAPPAVSLVEPDHGPIEGGTDITITGSNFFTGVTVTLGHASATILSVTDAEIRARTLPADAGAVDVVVTNPDGESVTLPAGFTYTGFRRYFAEGAANSFFDCVFHLANPSATEPANVTMRFLRSNGATFEHALVVPAGSHRAVDAKSVPGLTPADGISTVIESNIEVVAERTMSWGGGYGSHAEAAVKSPATTWYLAEGATHSNFALYYLIQNPNPNPIDVQITYLLKAPKAPVVRVYHDLPASSRTTICVNADPDVSHDDVSGVVTSLTPGHPIIVERALYLNNEGRQFNAGTDSAGTTAPATDWFLAEGATLNLFDMYVLLANPGAVDGTATLTYLLTDGRTGTKSYPVAARSRQTVWVNGEVVNGIPLAAVSLSTLVHADVPIIVERAMWWPMGGGASGWREGHGSVASTETGTAWAVAAGEQGGTSNAQTYLLVANTSPFPGRVRLTALDEGGTNPWTEIEVPPNSRTTVWTGGTTIGPDTPFGGLLAGQRFGALVESLPTSEGTASLVVERATYSDAGGIHWAAGTGSVATKIR